VAAVIFQRNSNHSSSVMLRIPYVSAHGQEALAEQVLVVIEHEPPILTLSDDRSK